MFQKGWVASNDGNITVRLDAERILATPTGVCKGLMHPDELIIVDTKGNKIAGRAERTSEIAMHLAVYELRPDIKAIVHAHPACATAYAAAGIPLNKALISEVVLALGCIPLTQYGTPGTPELTDALREYTAFRIVNRVGMGAVQRWPRTVPTARVVWTRISWRAGSPLIEIGTSPTPNTYSMLNCPGPNGAMPTLSGSISRVKVSDVSRCTRVMRYSSGTIALEETPGVTGTSVVETLRAHIIHIQQL